MLACTFTFSSEKRGLSAKYTPGEPRLTAPERWAADPWTALLQRHGKHQAASR